MKKYNSTSENQNLNSIHINKDLMDSKSLKSSLYIEYKKNKILVCPNCLRVALIITYQNINSAIVILCIVCNYEQIYSLKNYMNIISNGSIYLNHKCGICNKNTDSIPIKYCFDHHFMLCSNCFENHSYMCKNDKLSSDSFDLKICIKHEENYLFFCRNCADFLCENCLSTHKQDHIIYYLEDEKRKIDIEGMEKIIRKYKEYIKNDYFSYMKSEVVDSEKYNEFKNKLQEEYEKFLNSLKEYLNLFELLLNNFKNDKDNVINIVNLVINTLIMIDKPLGKYEDILSYYIKTKIYLSKYHFSIGHYDKDGTENSEENNNDIDKGLNNSNSNNNIKNNYNNSNNRNNNSNNEIINPLNNIDNNNNNQNNHKYLLKMKLKKLLHSPESTNKVQFFCKYIGNDILVYFKNGIVSHYSYPSYEHKKSYLILSQYSSHITFFAIYVKDNLFVGCDNGSLLVVEKTKHNNFNTVKKEKIMKNKSIRNIINLSNNRIAICGHFDFISIMTNEHSEIKKIHVGTCFTISMIQIKDKETLVAGTDVEDQPIFFINLVNYNIEGRFICPCSSIHGIIQISEKQILVSNGESIKIIGFEDYNFEVVDELIFEGDKATNLIMIKDDFILVGSENSVFYEINLFESEKHILYKFQKNSIECLEHINDNMYGFTFKNGDDVMLIEY